MDIISLVIGLLFGVGIGWFLHEVFNQRKEKEAFERGVAITQMMYSTITNTILNGARGENEDE